MAIRVMSLVWDSEVPNSYRLTLLALADRADEDGLCWPSVAWLVRKTRSGESTIRRHLKDLAAMGILRIEHRTNDSSKYWIMLDRLRQTSQIETPSQTETSQSETPSRSETSQSEQSPPLDLSTDPSRFETQYVSDTSVDPSGAPPRRRATRIPENFTVTEPMVAWARRECPGVDGRFETAQFVDYWAAKAGKDATKVDWTRTWQTWMRRAQQQAGSGPGRSNNQLRLVRDQFADLTYADLYDRADAITAAKLIRGVWSDPARKPSDPDPTPHWVWVLGPRREFIAANRDKICAALDARRAAG